MALTPNPFAHEALTEQREERLARRAALHQAIGYQGPTTRSPRKRLATILRAIADRLAQPEPAAAQRGGANHIHIRPEGHSQIRSKG